MSGAINADTLTSRSFCIVLPLAWRNPKYSYPPQTQVMGALKERIVTVPVPTTLCALFVARRTMLIFKCGEVVRLISMGNNLFLSIPMDLSFA